MAYFIKPVSIAEVVEGVSLTAKSYDLAVAQGEIAGVSCFSKFGQNSDVDNTREDIWEAGGDYTYPAAGGIQMQIVSTDIADNPASTGSWTVRVSYLDGSGLEATEDLTMDGQTPVLTVATDILRVNYLSVQTSGTNLLAEGTITLESVGGAEEYCRITAGGNQSLTSVYTVPANKNLFLTQWSVSTNEDANADATEHYLRVTTNSQGEITPGLFHFKANIGTLGAPAVITLGPLKCPPLSDVKVSSIANGAVSNVTVNTNYIGLLIDV